MTTYSITNRTSGLDLGTYTASTVGDALEQLAADAGYSSYQDQCESLGETVEAARADLVVTVLEVDVADTARLARAHEIGRECCEFWLDYRDQPGTSADPSDWELSDLDRETALIELCVELDSPLVPAVHAALEAGFAERRAELA